MERREEKEDEVKKADSHHAVSSTLWRNGDGDGDEIMPEKRKKKLKEERDQGKWWVMV